MGREDGAEGWLEYFHAATQAWLADQVTLGQLPADIATRGWKAALARALGIHDVQVSRWASDDPNTRRIPDVESCRMLAKLWGVSPIDVLVAAGHLDPEDAQMKEPPQPPRPNPDPHLARLAALLDSDAPEDVKARIRAMLTAAADLGELSSSAERPTGRSA